MLRVRVAVGSASAVIGFVAVAMLGTTDSVDLPDETGMPLGRTALLFPVYREDSHAVAGAIKAIRQEIAAAGATLLFDVFVLSDTQDPAERTREHDTYQRLRAEVDIGVYARWRTPNVAEKGG